MSDHEIERVLVYYNLTPAQTYQEREFASQRLKIAIEALEFYADKENWFKNKYARASMKIGDLVNVGTDVFNQAIYSGGKRARQALEQIKKGL